MKDEVDRRRDGLLLDAPRGARGTIGGRVVMDAWWQARTTLRPERRRSPSCRGSCSRMTFACRRWTWMRRGMDEEWDSRPDVVLDYCERDALLPLEILDTIRATRRKEAIGSVAKVTLETAVNGSTSQLLDSLVVRLAEQRGVERAEERQCGPEGRAHRRWLRSRC